MARRQALFFLTAILVLVQASAQTSTPSTTTSQPATASAAAATVMPSDPKELMLLASKVNGLGDMDKPWHLKANYQTFDADGKPKDQGTFEEWWAGPEKYKLSYTSAGLNQVRYQNGAGLLMTGDARSPSLAEAMVEEFLVRPLRGVSEITANNYTAHNAMDGSVELKCLHKETMASVIPVYCFQADSPGIRLEALEDGYMVFFNDIVQMNGQYVAKQIDIKFGNLSVLDVQVTAVEMLSKVEDAAFVPPATAVVALLPPQIAPHGAMDLISVGKPLEIPTLASNAGIHSVQMVVAVIVSKTGDVSDVRVISGPSLVRQAAADSARTFHFKPYLLNGQPVEVEVVIFVNHVSGRR